MQLVDAAAAPGHGEAELVSGLSGKALGQARSCDDDLIKVQEQRQAQTPASQLASICILMQCFDFLEAVLVNLTRILSGRGWHPSAPALPWPRVPASNDGRIVKYCAPSEFVRCFCSAQAHPVPWHRGSFLWLSVGSLPARPHALSL